MLTISGRRLFAGKKQKEHRVINSRASIKNALSSAIDIVPREPKRHTIHQGVMHVFYSVSVCVWNVHG